ncbi:MAG: preprotein translocase subunit SecE [Lachnospiraceae bacterium]|nr:preprotein translocase subunit SecE [Lachnospiraceae bacterium]
MADEKNASKSSKPKKSFFKGVKTEFKKIVWPDKATLARETTAVVIISVILGAVIALIDYAIKLGLDKIIV